MAADVKKNKELAEDKIKYELTLSSKVPCKAQFAIAGAEIKVFVKEDEDLESVVDEVKDQLENALAAAILVTDKNSHQR